MIVLPAEVSASTPKGVMLSHHNMVANTLQISCDPEIHCDVRPEDVRARPATCAYDPGHPLDPSAMDGGSKSVWKTALRSTRI